MANFSDDEAFEKIDEIIGQRKRKGAVEYLVRWKNQEDNNESWTSALSLGSKYAKIIQNFLESQKSEKRRSTSRSRKVSRSRSRSSSRNRKSTSTDKSASKSRSRSRGRPRKSDSAPIKVETSDEADGNIKSNSPSKNTRGRRSVVIKNSYSDSALEGIIRDTTPSTPESSAETKSNAADSNNMAASASTPPKEQLEVQRTHNERCPTRDEDRQPRSLVWRVADYAVIVLFIVSLIAAIFLFLEKVIDLEDFKSQAFPNLQTLKTRLADGVQSLLDSAFYQLERVGDFWLYLTQQSQEPTAAPQNPTPA